MEKIVKLPYMWENVTRVLETMREKTSLMKKYAKK